MADLQTRSAPLASAPAVPEPSLVPALRLIAEIATLSPDWDSYGAAPPSPRAIAWACLLIEAVAEAGDRAGAGRRSPWTSAPIADGGLQIEWLGGEGRIEVQVAPDGSVGYVLVPDAEADTALHEADGVPFATMVDLIVDVLTAPPAG